MRLLTRHLRRRVPVGADAGVHLREARLVRSGGHPGDLLGGAVDVRLHHAAQQGAVSLGPAFGGRQDRRDRVPAVRVQLAAHVLRHRAGAQLCSQLRLALQVRLRGVLPELTGRVLRQVLPGRDLETVRLRAVHRDDVARHLPVLRPVQATALVRVGEGRRLGRHVLLLRDDRAGPVRTDDRVHRRCHATAQGGDEHGLQDATASRVQRTLSGLSLHNRLGGLSQLSLLRTLRGRRGRFRGHADHCVMPVPLSWSS